MNNAISSGERGKPGSSIKGMRVGLIGSQGVIVVVEGIIRIRLGETKVRRVRYQLPRSTSRITVSFEGKGGADTCFPRPSISPHLMWVHDDRKCREPKSVGLRTIRATQSGGKQPVEVGKQGDHDTSRCLTLEKGETSVILLDPRVQLHLCCFSAIGCYHYDECGRPSSSIWFSDWICAQ